MYVPEAFRQGDPRLLFEHVSSYPFATLITQGTEGVVVSHVPLLFDAERGLLRGHLARENPQVEDLALGKEALAIFQGPHGYVSPSVYLDAKPSVPTWNYAVVHVRGRPGLVGTTELRVILDAMVARFETSAWRLDESPEFLDRMLGAIAGFEIAIESVEGKWKLSQNRSPEDRSAVVAWLERGDDSGRALAKFMRMSDFR